MITSLIGTGVQQAGAVWQSREEAGSALARQLAAYRQGHGVVVGIPRGGVCVASALAEAWGWPLEIMPCRPIQHPANLTKSIGSVSGDDVYIHDWSPAIPQDYLYHQVVTLRYAVSRERRCYYGGRQPRALAGRHVMVVTDVLFTADNVLACVRRIKKQKASALIVAAVVASDEAVRWLQKEAATEVLRCESSLLPMASYFADFHDVSDYELSALLAKRHEKPALHQHTY